MAQSWPSELRAGLGTLRAGFISHFRLRAGQSWTWYAQSQPELALRARLIARADTKGFGSGIRLLRFGRGIRILVKLDCYVVADSKSLNRR